MGFSETFLFSYVIFSVFTFPSFWKQVTVLVFEKGISYPIIQSLSRILGTNGYEYEMAVFWNVAPCKFISLEDCQIQTYPSPKKLIFNFLKVLYIFLPPLMVISKL
jgi:hypothetical protein